MSSNSYSSLFHFTLIIAGAASAYWVFSDLIKQPAFLATGTYTAMFLQIALVGIFAMVPTIIGFLFSSLTTSQESAPLFWLRWLEPLTLGFIIVCALEICGPMFNFGKG